MHFPLRLFSLAAILFCHWQQAANAQDWPRFRGPDGMGVSPNINLPARWSETSNLHWKVNLPGPGSSSPIIYGERLFLTCSTGKGRELKRHLLCFDKMTGKKLWQQTVDAAQPEDRYSGYLTEHGYASNTPTCDGQRVYAFLGKSGVFAFDLDGKKVWSFDVGKQSSNRRWGSAASPILLKDLLIINAGEEGRAIFALDKATGKQIWKAAGNSLELAFGTPVIAKLNNGTQELLISAVGELWSIYPSTGKLKAYKTLRLNGNITPSVVFENDIAYTFGGYPSTGGQAIKMGGRKVLPESDVLWSTQIGSYVATPLLHDGHLYWVTDKGQAVCLNAASGEEIYRQRLKELKSGGRPFYASPVYVDGKIIVPSRRSGIFVFAAKPKFEQLGINRFEDDSNFNASIAVSSERLFLRSDESLYCVGHNQNLRKK
ncbi:PQQ-like beta-propeller repeat protein [bacterium]|nr:PQQ-like beta-propeller repeat protein [bacterium]